MQITYRSDIDGLRAIAVIAVLGFHAFPEWFPGGFIGVDVFFVISGYLITSILIKEHDQGLWRITRFYARRILRIFPALLLVLLVCVYAGWHVLLADEYKQLGKHVAAGAGFVANWAFWFEAGYFDRASELKPLLHLWSLGIEEQFYIAWPLLLWAGWHWHAQLRRSALLLALASFASACVMVYVDRTHAFYSPLTRAWELLAGALVALYWPLIQMVLRDKPLGSIRWLALILIGLSILLMQARDPFPGAMALIPVLSTAVLISSGPGIGSTQQFLSSKPMVWIGLISYPLYLWHWPLLSFARIMQGDSLSLGLRGMLLLFSLLLAAATYRWLERPMRRLPMAWSVGFLTTFMVLVALVGSNVFVRDGLERIRYKRIIQISETANQDFIDFEKSGLITAATCDEPFRFPEKDVCLVHQPNRTVTAVVLGDSHAVHAFWGLADAMSRSGLNLKVMGKGACVPLLDHVSVGDPFKCQPHMNQTLQAIAANPSIRSVALVYRGRYLGAAASVQEINAFEDKLDRTLTLLVQAGKRVHYFLPVVEPGFDPRLCVGSLPWGRQPPRSCVIDPSADVQTTANLQRVIQQVRTRHPQVRFIDPNALICENGACPIFQDGRSLFKDENHLSHFGSMRIGQRLSLQ